MKDIGRKAIILALDELTLDQALELCSKVGDRIFAVKGHSIVDHYGPGVVSQLLQAGAPQFWEDAKLLDIPNTVRLRAQAIASSGVNILTLQAEGEIEMMLAGRKGGSGMKLYAITVLTSLSEEEVQLQSGHSVKATVLYRARLAKLAGMDGIVCSPQEVELIAKRPELNGLEIVVPGSRSAGKDHGDQKRVGTPTAVIKAAGDRLARLVIGRQVTQASDPIAALEELEAEIAAAIKEKEAGVP
ncbi:MAG TPA: orotidine-5'-phosphate decarboxylase [Candidatus Paceibacterota bacterium]|nr:orotidine-5'-phosphate decarboxylase [Candidatus Paceibacterota bacterium]